MKIVVKAPNWIGDTVMITPSLKRLKKISTDAEIIVISNRGCGEVLKNNPNVNDIWIMNEKENWTSFLKAAKKIKECKVDIGILFPNSFSSALLLYLGKVKRRVGYNRDGRGILLSDKIKLTPERLTKHQVDYYLDVLNPLEDPKSTEKWDDEFTKEKSKLEIFVTDKERQLLEEYLKSKHVSLNNTIVAINPGGAFGSSKRWFPDRFGKVADFLAQKYDARIFITGSPKENEIFQEIQKSCKYPLIDSTMDMDLRLLCAFLEKCKLLITNDSGSMHIGAAINCPIISIFGPTDPNLTAPYNEKSVVVYRKTDCSPCFLKICPIDHKCMSDIQVQDITHHIIQIFDKKIFDK